MNFMDEKDLKPEKKTEESEDGYSFMNETVKPPPPDVGKLRKTILKLIAAGAIFGLTAGLIFRLTSGIGEQSPVKIPQRAQSRRQSPASALPSHRLKTILTRTNLFPLSIPRKRPWINISWSMKQCGRPRRRSSPLS